MASQAKAWGMANVRNGGGLAQPVAPRQDDRLLFALYDNERAVRETAMDTEQLCDDMQKVAAAVERLDMEGLHAQFDMLTRTVEKLTAVIEELVSQRA